MPEGRGHKFNRRGSAFLLAMALLVVGGLVASQLVPNEVTLVQRRQEQDLKHNLGSLRMAIELERIASFTPLYESDWSSRTQFLKYLDALIDHNLLPSVPADPLVPGFQWGSGTGKVYWIPTRNYLASSSFELIKLSDSTWATGSPNILATVTSQYWTGQFDPSLDSFANENRFGAILKSSGTSLLIIKP